MIFFPRKNPESKGRIYEYWQEHHSTQEKAEFLKKEYGTGGHSHACSGATHSGQDHDAKGICYHKGGCDKVQLFWTQVAQRLDSLMKQERYLTQEEVAQRDAIEEAKADPMETVEERFVVTETSDAFEPGNDFAVWDKEQDDYYVQDDGTIQTFETETEAEEYLETVKLKQEVPEWNYQVGDTFYLDDTAFEITEISNREVQLRDPSLLYPIFRAENRERFEEMLSLDERNYVLRGVAQSEEKVAVTEKIQNEINTDPEQPEHFIDHFYVAEDVQKRGALDIKEYSSFEDALRAYHELPNTQRKALGAMNTRKPLPGSLDLIQCVDGKDTIIQDYVKVDGWQNAEVMDIISQIEQSITTREVPSVPAVNFHITDDHIGEGGAKQKFGRNIEAIKTLFRLESENRNATPEEQEILSQYVGWGGLADAFEPNKENWSQEYATLKQLLSEEEYMAARASTLNAHYTSPTVIRAMYDALGQMGFETGNILEPAMGVGNFFGMLPPEMQSSRLYGVELDSISGRIAQKLYPHAEIKVAGFETTDRRDFYDVAVGNVPFGNYKVSDKPYDKLGFSIHNYFFAKALDQVRPGGVVAFVTSRYTMDSKNSDARRYLAQRAELLGAIRLPNDAFKKNAGAEVVSDIIFLQKRDHPIDLVPDWVHLNRTEDRHIINSYFVDHPEMVLGELVEESTAYGMDITVRPKEGVELADLLKKAVSNIQGTYQAVELPEADSQGKQPDTIPASPDVKNYSYAVVDGEIYFRENSIMRHVELNEKAKERIKGMVELRGIVNQLIEYQLEDYPDQMIRQKQVELNDAYDAFTAKHGLLNNRANGQVFADDSSYYLLCSLENVDDEGNLKSKKKKGAEERYYRLSNTAVIQTR